MRHLALTLALIGALAGSLLAAETVSARLRLDGRVSPDAELYQRTYPTQAGSRVRSRSRCPRNRSFLGALSRDALTCGSGGTTFPEEMINGGCPITACIIKKRSNGGPFGSMDF